MAVTNAFTAPITDIEMVKEVSEPSMRVTVRMMFGQRVRGSEGPNVTRDIDLDPQGSDSILTVKSKIAVCDHWLPFSSVYCVASAGFVHAKQTRV